MDKDLPPNQIGHVLDPPEDSDSLRAEPDLLLRDNPIDLRILRELSGVSILEAGQFSREQVIELSKLAAILEKTEIAPYPLPHRQPCEYQDTKALQVSLAPLFCQERRFFLRFWEEPL